MAYVFLALLLFGASVMTHVLFCRWTKVPGLHTRVFALIAFIFGGIYVVGASTSLMPSVLDPHSLWGMPFKVTAGVIFVFLIPVYLIFYVLTQLVSPSQKILLTMAHRGSLTYEDILLCIREEDFINKRLSDLCTSGCVKMVQGRYILSASGQKIATTLNIMQYMLGRDIGG